MGGGRPPKKFAGFGPGVTGQSFSVCRLQARRKSPGIAGIGADGNNLKLRAGVYWHERYSSDLFFITLDKSDLGWAILPDEMGQDLDGLVSAKSGGVARATSSIFAGARAREIGPDRRRGSSIPGPEGLLADHHARRLPDLTDPLQLAIPELHEAPPTNPACVR